MADVIYFSSHIIQVGVSSFIELKSSLFTGVNWHSLSWLQVELFFWRLRNFVHLRLF